MIEEIKSIIIFDGVCNFCNKSVNFIIKRDLKSTFLFTPNQSLKAQELLKRYNLSDASLDTLILVKNDKCYVKSEAVFEIIKELSAFWYLFGIFRVFPLGIRDNFYDFISKNRYSFFGKRDVCMMPNEQFKKRFL